MDFQKLMKKKYFFLPIYYCVIALVFFNISNPFPEAGIVRIECKIYFLPIYNWKQPFKLPKVPKVTVLKKEKLPDITKISTGFHRYIKASELQPKVSKSCYCDTQAEGQARVG